MNAVVASGKCQSVVFRVLSYDKAEVVCDEK